MATLRQEMMTRLTRLPMDVRDLATALDLREAEAADHLQHMARSLKAQGRKLQITPAYCRQCEFVFRKRRRFTRPGRCPRCKSSRIQGALYRVDL